MTEENLSKAITMSGSIKRLRETLGKLDPEKSDVTNQQYSIGIAILQGGSTHNWNWITHLITINEELEKLIIEDLKIKLELLEKEFKEL